MVELLGNQYLTLGFKKVWNSTTYTKQVVISEISDDSSNKRNLENNYVGRRVSIMADFHYKVKKVYSFKQRAQAPKPTKKAIPNQQI